MECKKGRDYGHMVFDYYIEVLQEIRKQRKKKLKEIKTRKQAEKYQEYILSVIKKAFPLPQEKTLLNAKITGILEKQGYRIEKVLFESRPNFLVTGNFYVPSILKEKVPGVLVPCGHSSEGKIFPRYQEICLRLVKSGFAVFIYDPISQGERDQYFHLEQNSPLRKGPCPAHNMMGKQLELIGEFFGAWRVWDGIRALDYLLSRTEVDTTNIGITGNSGGGTLTTWLWALDERFTMAAPSCFVTTFFANLENELPSDSEQCPPGILERGLEQADFFILRAPKPVILLGQKYDFFDIRGLKETWEELKNFYSIFNAEKHLSISIGNNVHGYFPEQQKEMLKFFCKNTGKKPYRDEVSPLVEKNENLWVTKTGQVVAEGSKPAYKIISEKAKNITENRKNITINKISFLTKKVLKLDIPILVPHYRILRSCQYKDVNHIIGRFAVKTERNINTILYKITSNFAESHFLETEKTIHLYIPNISAIEDIYEEPLVDFLVTKGTLYTVDVRGIGESMPDIEENFFEAYGRDYMLKSYGLMLDKPYLGRRVYDVLQVLNLLKNKGAKSIYLYGRGQGSIIALFTGIISKNIKKITLKNGPSSFYEWTQVPYVTWPDANFPRDILKYFDIPDCLEAFGEKVEIIEPWGPDMNSLCT